MKRFTAILAAAAVILATAACREKEREVDLSENEAHARYVSAVGKITEADSFAGFIILTGAFSLMDMNRENNVVIGIKHIFGPGDNFQAEIDASWTELSFLTYYRDGEYFLNAQDDSFRYAMSGSSFLRMTLSMLVTEILFSAEDVFGLDVVEDADGTAMRFEVYQTGMQDVLRQLAEFEDTGGFEMYGEEAVSYEFQDVVVRMRIDKSGALRDIRLAFLYIATHHHIDEGAAVSGYLEIGMDVKQIGGVTIEFPEDMYSYPDLAAEWEQR